MHRVTSLIVVLVIFLAGASVAADGYVRIDNTHQAFMGIVDQQDWYFNDSVLIQVSHAILAYDQEIFDNKYSVRVVRFDEGMVYAIDFPEKEYSVIPIERFREVYRDQREESVDQSKKYARLEDKHLESRRRTLPGGHLRRHGRWIERFEWQTDTVDWHTPIETGLGPGHVYEMKRTGKVKKRDDDFLYIERSLETVETDSILDGLGERLVELYDIDIGAPEFLDWFFTRYYFRSTEGFLTDWFHEPVPLGAGFDTTALDLPLPTEGTPVAHALRVEINQRDRNAKIGGKSVSYANEDYAIKLLFEEEVFFFDSIAVIATETAEIPDSLLTIPESFDLQESFDEKRIERFFDTKSWIVRWHHVLRIL